VRLHLLITSSLCVALVFAGTGPLFAETEGGRAAIPLPDQAENSIQSLRLVARHAGMIFSGTAIRVEHLSADSPGTVATTRITFRVQTAIRGVRVGQVIAIREWDGLWNSGERYRPGERVLLFLFPKSQLGLTSPVGGRMGRFRVDDAGRVEVPSDLGGGGRPKPIQLRTLAAEIRRAVGE
jgi:hypothetical protein